MKIAIFTDSFLPGVGGTEKAVLGLAQALSKDNEVLVCCPYYTKKYKDQFSFKVIRARSVKLTKNDYYAFPSISSKFKEELSFFKPDIIHCQSISPMATFAIKYAQKNNIPVIMTIHTKFKMAFAHSIKSKLIVNLLINDMVKKLKLATKVFTVSNVMKKELEDYGFYGECDVIKNGSMFEINENEEYDKTLLYKFGIKESDNLLLYVGHIVKFKNIQFLLDSIKILQSQISNFKMIFIGSGLDDSYFKKKVKQMNLEDNVIFTGVIKDKHILKSFYHFSKLFLFPSFFDTDGLVVIEAATAKTPTLTLQGTACCERIENNKSGFIVENNPKVFAEKIYYLLNNPSVLTIVGEEAFKKIPKNWDITANEYLEIYNELINKKTLIEDKNNLAI